MIRNLLQFEDRTFDLLVIGGGIQGACAARDAALRGLSVALVEKGDFGAATSANSLKIVHGGLRYLQQFNLRRMRQSIRERSLWFRVAPHLIRPLPILVPTYGNGKQGRAALRAALTVSDLFGFDRNRIAGSSECMPRSRVIGREECLQLFPGFEKDGLTGGALWYDGQVTNSERLTLSCLLSAAAQGAVLANYTRAERLLTEGRRVCGVRVLDLIGDESFDIRARVVLNATGPWACSLLPAERGGDASEDVDTGFALAINLVSGPKLADLAIGVRSKRNAERDPVGGGGRYLFLAPWRDRTLIGTYYRLFDGKPEDAEPSTANLLDFVAECNQACPSLDLSLDDVSFYHWGLLPRRGPGRSSRFLAAKARVIDHSEHEGLAGLITVVGVKYTTARLLAERAVDRVFAHLGRTPSRCITGQVPVWGGEGGLRPGSSWSGQSVPGVSNAAVRRMRESYGDRWLDVNRAGKDEAGWSEPVTNGTPVLRCEVLWGIRQEMALKLSDVVFRRTDLGSARCPSRAALEAVADLMAAELGWTPRRWESEIQEVLRVFRPLEVSPAG